MTSPEDKKPSVWSQAPQMTTAETAPRSDASSGNAHVRTGAGLLAFVVALLAFLAGGLLVILFGPDLTFLDRIGKTASSLGPDGSLPIGVGLLLALSLIIGGFVADPHFKRDKEFLITSIGGLMIMSASWFNVATRDVLIGWQTQLLMDALQIVFAVAILSILSGWRPRVHLLRGVKFLAGYIVGAFALAYPLFLATMAVLSVLGVTIPVGDSVETQIKVLSALLGLPVAAAFFSSRKFLNGGAT